MNLDAFLTDRRPEWDELEGLLRDGSKAPERLGADRARRLGSLYRSAAADLAIARRRYPLDPVVPALENLVRRGHSVVYRNKPRRRSVRQFLTRGYWEQVRARPVMLLIAGVLLLAPLGLTAAWAHGDPGAAGGLVPGGTQALTEPRPEGASLGLSAGEKSAFASEIFTNNVQVSLLAVAGGLAAGLLTGAVLVFNGLSIGAVVGIGVGAGNGGILAQLTLPHGVLELSCIVVAGAAGLRTGWAIVDPGRRPRSQALRAEAGAAIEIVLGTALWLVVAGLVEGLITPVGLGVPAAAALGFGLAALYWVLVWRLGRPEPTSGLGSSP